jgi:uncharacterized protein
VAAPACITCGALYKPQAVFCSACGLRRAADIAPTNDIRVAIWFFVALLAVLVPSVVYVVHFKGNVFYADVAGSAGLLVVTLVFSIASRRLWWPLYRTIGFRGSTYGLIVLAAPAVMAVVYGYTKVLARIFDIHVPSELEVFAGHHVVWAIGLVTILPPIVEELAFRGIMYTSLRQTLGVSESIVISSFAFGLLHLSIPALVTHVPLGIYFCYLRERSGSLWPSMLAHALHNAGVLVVESLL